MSDRFDVQVTYFRRDRIAEVFFSVFIAGIFTPGQLFREMPGATGLRDSAHLLALYLSVPTLMMTLTFGTAVPAIAPNFIAGLLMVVAIFPLSISIGVASSLLWAWYLSRVVSRFTRHRLSVETAFQICAYSGPPFVIAWGPYLGPVMALWNMLLIWKGLVHHAGIPGWMALLVMASGVLLLALIVVALAALMMLLLPDNMNMLIETVEAYMATRGW